MSQQRPGGPPCPRPEFGSPPGPSSLPLRPWCTSRHRPSSSPRCLQRAAPRTLPSCRHCCHRLQQAWGRQAKPGCWLLSQGYTAVPPLSCIPWVLPLPWVPLPLLGTETPPAQTQGTAPGHGTRLGAPGSGTRFGAPSIGTRFGAPGGATWRVGGLCSWRRARVCPPPAPAPPAPSGCTSGVPGQTQGLTHALGVSREVAPGTPWGD